jgi:hypothetical protein
MFLKDTKKHVIALETGINKLSKNGFDQYNNYEEVHQEAIKELKK